MEYRRIGATGMEASVIGLGAEHLDNKPYEVVEETIHAAMEHGINIMDMFMPGREVRTNIGKALAGNRDKFIIQGHIGSTDQNQQYDISRDLPTCKRYFEEMLHCLGTDYIDCGMLFFIDSEKDFDKIFNSDIATYAQQLKQQGTIRAIGASSHNPVIARKVVETGIVELLLFSINPAFDMVPATTDVLSTFEDSFTEDVYKGIRPERLELYQLCERRDVAITVMKTLGAGKLLSKEHTPFAWPMTVGQCIHYVLTRPAVVSALVGCQSRAQIEEAVGYLKLTDEERDYAAAISSPQHSFKGHCVYCSHCQPCPADIDIAAVNKYLDIAKLDEQNIPPSILQHYLSLGVHGSDCIACGQCEQRCPFTVPVIENMQSASGLFGQ